MEIKTCGLVNTGNICYFNSFVQALISLKHFREYITDEDNPIFDDLKTVITIDGIHDICKTKELLTNRLKELATSTNSAHYRFGNRQEDATEGIHLFMEVIDCPKIQQLFSTRYVEHLMCKCGYMKQIHTGETHIKNIGISITFSIDELRPLNDDFMKTLLCRYSKLDGYVCPSCNSHDAIYKVHNLSRLSKCLIIILEKYCGKIQVNLPNIFTIVGTDNNLIYNMVAIIDHHGSTRSGHYTCQAI